MHVSTVPGLNGSPLAVYPVEKLNYSFYKNLIKPSFSNKLLIGIENCGNPLSQDDYHFYTYAAI